MSNIGITMDNPFLTKQFVNEIFGLPKHSPYYKNPKIKKVIFNDPATIVIWSDDSKTVVKCQEGDTYSKELGLAMCISKKYLGNKGNFNEEFKKWIPEESEEILKKDTDFKIGDKVKVIDRELTYDTYDDWDGLGVYKSHFVNYSLPKNDRTYKIVNIAPHVHDGDVALIQDLDNTQVFIISKKGLKLDNGEDILPYKVGTEILIGDTKPGCTGAIRKRGVITRDKSTHGLLNDKPGFNVKISDTEIWRINPDASIKVLL